MITERLAIARQIRPHRASLMDPLAFLPHLWENRLRSPALHFLSPSRSSNVRPDNDRRRPRRRALWMRPRFALVASLVTIP